MAANSAILRAGPLTGASAVPDSPGKVAKNAPTPGCCCDGLVAFLDHRRVGANGARCVRGGRAFGLAVTARAVDRHAAARHGGDRKAGRRRVSLTAPDGSVAAKSPERQGGP